MRILAKRYADEDGSEKLLELTAKIPPHLSRKA